jgi:hypothetical protein
MTTDSSPLAESLKPMTWRALGNEPKQNLTLIVSVNYDRSVEELLKAGGYDWADENITAKNFPSKRNGMADLEIVVIEFKNGFKSDDVVEWLDKHSFRPAELPELLAFGEEHLDMQCNCSVVALGSWWHDRSDYRRVPCLDVNSDQRKLGLVWWGHKWESNYRFTAIRK